MCFTCTNVTVHWLVVSNHSNSKMNQSMEQKSGSVNKRGKEVVVQSDRIFEVENEKVSYKSQQTNGSPDAISQDNLDKPG